MNVDRTGTNPCPAPAYPSLFRVSGLQTRNQGSHLHIQQEIVSTLSFSMGTNIVAFPKFEWGLSDAAAGLLETF